MTPAAVIVIGLLLISLAAFFISKQRREPASMAANTVEITNNDGSVSASVQYAPGQSKAVAPGATEAFEVSKGDKGAGHLDITAPSSVSMTVKHASGPDTLAVSGAGGNAKLAPGESVSITAQPTRTTVREAS